MEDWELDFYWLQLQHKLKDIVQSDGMPDIKSILFLIGVQEFGRVKANFTKEEKQDLMHIAACSLLEDDGYYIFAGRDEEGWPHWEIGKPFTMKGVQEQEVLLKKNILKYFKDLD